MKEAPLQGRILERVWSYAEEGCRLVKHDVSKSDEMQADHGFGQSFIVFGKMAEPGRPGEGVFDDLPPGQQHEAALRLRQVDDCQLDAVASRVSPRSTKATSTACSVTAWTSEISAST